MSSVTLTVLATVNGPYGTMLSAEQLAAKISDVGSAAHYDPAAFSFFSEVDQDLQQLFIAEMGVDPADALSVARKFSRLAGYEMPFSRAA